tara:strand:- start:130997 stop:132253 length:1257 start_codon:yes stop_codon:yes gene_type:complete
VIWLGLEKVLRILFSLVATFFVARELGAEKFGALNYIFGLVLITSTIANLGFDSLLVREVSLQEFSKRKLVISCFKIKSIVIFVGIAFLALFMSYLDPSPLEKSLFIPFVLVLFLSAFQVFEFYFLAVTESRLSVSAYFWGGILANLGKIIGLYFGVDLVFIAYMYVLEYFVSGFLMYFYFYKNTSEDSKEIKEGTIKAILMDSLPLVLAGVSVMIYMKIDQIMLRSFLGLREVGEYSAAVKLSEGIYFIPVVIVGSYFSKWVKEYKFGDDYLRSVEKVVSFLMLVAFSYMSFIWIFGDYVVNILYGDQYLKTAEILRLHTISAFFVFLGVVSSKVLILKNLEKIVFYMSLIGAALNICLNLYFIPNFGGEGAAVATILSYFFSGYFCLFFFRSTRKIAFRISKSIFPIWLFKMNKNQ